MGVKVWGRVGAMDLTQVRIRVGVRTEVEWGLGAQFRNNNIVSKQSHVRLFGRIQTRPAFQDNRLN